MVKQSILYPDYRILLSNKKEQTIDIHNNLAEFSKNYVGEKKSQSEKVTSRFYF